MSAHWINHEAVVGHFIISNTETLEAVLTFCHDFGIARYVYRFCDFLSAWCFFVFDDQTFHSIVFYSFLCNLNIEDAHV